MHELSAMLPFPMLQQTDGPKRNPKSKSSTSAQGQSLQLKMCFEFVHPLSATLCVWCSRCVLWLWVPWGDGTGLEGMDGQGGRPENDIMLNKHVYYRSCLYIFLSLSLSLYRLIYIHIYMDICIHMYTYIVPYFSCTFLCTHVCICTSQWWFYCFHIFSRIVLILVHVLDSQEKTTRCLNIFSLIDKPSSCI